MTEPLHPSTHPFAVLRLHAPLLDVKQAVARSPVVAGVVLERLREAL